MRTIKFRGKNIHTGEWLYGDYHREGKTRYITKPGDYLREYAPIEFIVDANTIGQFTGLYDKNGKEIYEHDIVLFSVHIKQEVVFSHGAFGYPLYGGEFISYAGNPNFTFNPLDRSKEHEVIGNIHDNPELIKRPEL